ncbi:CobW family GTP-binding protein [Peribacillus sp. SCS-155]|uniref:CobW family GTP-binding protein n=1 Tax=Peribacillus sedimenti TaxID=3115297 RepID=UPI0039066EC3
MNKIEIYILGGFLGSGKTTLLRNILEQEKAAERRTAVLLNEMGSISIDSGFIDDSVPLKELFDGCICCTIQDKLEVQLHELLENNELDAIYIETTGAAHPVEVLDGIMSPLFADRLVYKGIITVVDLLRWKDRHKLSPHLRQLLLEQILHADFIILNKQDLVTSTVAAELQYSIQSVNSRAFSVLTTQSKISLNTIQKVQMVPKSVHNQLDVHHLHLQTIVHRFNHSVSQEGFENWLRQLPDSIYRMKGYISFTHSQYPYLFQYTYGMPLYLNEQMKMPLNLVIIGENLDQEGIVNSLRQLEFSASNSGQ